MKVWILTRGSHDDYRIHGVYSTKEKARAIKAELEKVDRYVEVNEPEEWDVDDDLDFKAVKFWAVEIWMKDGRVRETYSAWMRSRPEDRWCFGVTLDDTIVGYSQISREDARSFARAERKRHMGDRHA